ncbi:MAG: GxxExxY protein [FCB group bacterium]|nr:GxxExxY protein [FCB group bacterium]
MELIYKDLAYQVIGCAMEVHKTLGPGFLESVYEEAMKEELLLNEIPHETQVPFTVYYKGKALKDFVCDLVIDGKIIVELKAVKKLGAVERAQVINYLNVTGLQLGLLINFSDTSLKYERIIQTKNSHNSRN